MLYDAWGEKAGTKGGEIGKFRRCGVGGGGYN